MVGTPFALLAGTCYRRQELVKLRRVMLAAQYRPGQPAALTMAETLEVQAAWAADAA